MPMLSEAVAETVTVPETVAPEVGAEIETAGEVVSPVTGGGMTTLFTVTETAVEVLVFPAVSRATAVRTCEPLEVLVLSKETEYGLVVSSLPRLVPSNLNCTPTTPILSEAVAETVVEPETMEPEVGAVMEMEGIVVSATILFTVTITLEEVILFPAASLATAVRVCEALEAVVLSQEIEYELVVSSLPRFEPSNLN
jgi:hypothetical protein